MGRMGWQCALLAVVVAGAGGTPIQAADREARGTLDVLKLYQQLNPGLTAREVAALAGSEGPLGTATEPVTSWLLWNQTPDGKSMEVLRAGFQDGRVTRLEYESF